MALIDINQGNKALEFITKRISDDKYRGLHFSQHNRYDSKRIVGILKLLDQYAPDKSLMTIRTTDLSKRPTNTAEEADYARFCDAAKDISGIGTQDAMRKNLFVDLHRMGLINRYNKKKELLDPFARSGVKYVSISDLGHKLISAPTILDQDFIFSKAIDTLLGGSIDMVLDILRDSDYQLDHISISEYMFFVSAIGMDATFKVNTDEAVELIKSYRTLAKTQRQAVLETLKSDLVPKKFTGSKIKKRDFHNWRNEAQQVFVLLNQTVYFEQRAEQLVLRTGKNSFEGEQTQKRLDRSLNEKYQYFVNHKLKGKISGFELHHVVPLAWSESQNHFKLLDKWQNMVYIDAFNHAKITQNKNRNVFMDFDNDNMTLSDYSKNSVYLKKDENLAYDSSKKTDLKGYNSELLKTIK
jgi:hypothetical protein